ncbi:MAG: short chain dehydrogenase [Candidatus Methanofastidiosum methylothiophilum]|uniref:Short chain dehydrogenase n=1 Tax=Candidatus Methanofastidiosum methylothiophilum TaxID=1705564 RepID=A0A150J697_9EURY|nr:MAG: short chain dehydrogenase [Candidatus Methanofastidiosum methylthiophilus]
MNKRIIIISIIFIIVFLCIFILLNNQSTDIVKQNSNKVEGMAKVGDINISYRTYGEGYPLVMIMGYGSTMEMWEDQLINSFSKDYKVIIFDNRGIGETSDGNKDFTIEQFAEDTNGLMNVLGIEKAHILGWSMGSYIAQELTLRHPEKVNKLVIYASVCSPEMFPPSPEVLSTLEDPSGTPEEQGSRWISVIFPSDWIINNGERIKEIFYRPLGNIKPENIGKQAIAIGKWEGTCSRISSINNKTLVIAGNEDVLVPPVNSEYLASKIPNSKLILVDGAGHALMFQYPDKFIREVTEFLK